MRVYAVTMFAAALSLALTHSASTQILVVDPGHGGPNASQTYNGDGFNLNRGSYGPAGTAEQWVNLNIAFALMDLANWDTTYYALTRYTDTANVDYPERVQLAVDMNADGFLSIHHNGLAPNVQAGWPIRLRVGLAVAYEAGVAHFASGLPCDQSNYKDCTGIVIL